MVTMVPPATSNQHAVAYSNFLMMILTVIDGWMTLLLYVSSVVDYDSQCDYVKLIRCYHHQEMALLYCYF